jgi:uncharacterized protein (DUF433 family)
MDALLARITTDPQLCFGKPCIRGLRYPVDIMLDTLASGMTWDEILEDFDDLVQDDLKAVLVYAANAVRRERARELSNSTM